jgi:hypothetical protein
VVLPPRIVEVDERTYQNPVCHEEASRRELDELKVKL